MSAGLKSPIDHKPQSHRDTEKTLVLTGIEPRLCASVSLWLVALGWMAIAASPAEAQTREFMFRGFADFGSTTLTAGQSFDAVLGSDRGAVLGGGLELVLPQRVSIAMRASRFRRTGDFPPEKHDRVRYGSRFTTVRGRVFRHTHTFK